MVLTDVILLVLLCCFFVAFVSLGVCVITFCFCCFCCNFVVVRFQIDELKSTEPQWKDSPHAARNKQMLAKWKNLHKVTALCCLLLVNRLLLNACRLIFIAITLMLSTRHVHDSRSRLFSFTAPSGSGELWSPCDLSTSQHIALTSPCPRHPGQRLSEAKLSADAALLDPALLQRSLLFYAHTCQLQLRQMGAQSGQLPSHVPDTFRGQLEWYIEDIAEFLLFTLQWVPRRGGGGGGEGRWGRGRWRSDVFVGSFSPRSAIGKGPTFLLYFFRIINNNFDSITQLTQLFTQCDSTLTRHNSMLIL